MFFEITVSPKEKKPKKSVERGYENSYSLELAPFQPQTKIILNCFINKFVMCDLIIKNNNNFNLKITLTKAPPQERCLSLSGEEWSLETKTNIVLNIKWRPQESGSWRDTIQLTDNRNTKYTVPLTLVCTDPRKKANSKLSKIKTKNYLDSKTKTILKVPNSSKSLLLSNIKSQPPVKSSISAACRVVDKENNLSNLLKWDCPQNHSLDINKAYASSIFSQDPSEVPDDKIRTTVRNETYVKVSKFIQPSQENVINDECINHHIRLNNTDFLQFSPKCCSTAKKSKKQSDSIDEKCKDDSDTSNALFNVNSIINSDSISEIPIRTRVKKNNFNLKPVCLAEIFEKNNDFNFETTAFSNNDYSSTNNLVTPKRFVKFTKSQADFGSSKDCIQANMWVKSRSTSLSPVSKGYI